MNHNLPGYIQDDIKLRLGTNEIPTESNIDDGVVMSKEQFKRYLDSKKRDGYISKMAVPNDGYIYVYNYLYITQNNKKPWFRNLGEFTVNNPTSNPISVIYEQQYFKTVNWDVAGTIS